MERRTVAHLFVDDLAEPALSDNDVHHLSRVLRLRPGELVSASDGRGGSRLCEWVGPAGSLTPVAAPVWEAPPAPGLTVGFALTKAEHPEWAVQKLTEAGADRIVVITTQRCITRWASSDGARRIVRLREVARQAAMQSRRSWLPSVDGPVPFSTLVGPPGADGAGSGIALAVQGGAPLTLATPTVLVGPEGGWTEDELAAVPDTHRISLGPNVLRAETAAMAAGVLMAALRAGLVVPASGSVPTGLSAPVRARA